MTSEEYTILLEKLDAIAKTSGWEKANVIATFLAIAVALFFPLREYIRTFSKYALKIRIPELREKGTDKIDKPHVSLTIKNLSKDILYVKEAFLYFDFKDYHNFRISIHLGTKSECKILPFSEEDVDFLIFPKDVYNTSNVTKHFLSTDIQLAKQYLSGLTGFEKVKGISLNIRTNLGRYYRKISRWAWEEVSEQLFDFAFKLDDERESIINKYTTGKIDNIRTNFKEYMTEMTKLNEKRYQAYKEKCAKGKQKEKEDKKRRKEFKKHRKAIS